MSVTGEFRQITSDKPSSVDAQNLVNSDSLIYQLQLLGSSELVGNATTDYDFVLRRGFPSVVNRSAKVDGGFVMQVPGMDTTVSVTMSEALDIVDSSVQQYFNRGKIRISSEFDSSSLEFNADGEDESSASVTISNKNGAVEPITIPWTKFQDSFRFE